ncbi:hypothetical protein RvY_02583 [Ramazzottius varieornatus]|uniref:Uncharacterized protein n=1 Tax=Ramazzottius varieornatus TaxID=947166 RepID=A0A1D1UVC5_RAMVA|nr:hypothetical protein RvY_02583 [Ramazzottius varieornatus]
MSSDDPRQGRRPGYPKGVISTAPDPSASRMIPLGTKPAGRMTAAIQNMPSPNALFGTSAPTSFAMQSGGNAASSAPFRGASSFTGSSQMRPASPSSIHIKKAKVDPGGLGSRGPGGIRTSAALQAQSRREIMSEEWQKLAVDGVDGKSMSGIAKMVASGDASLGETQVRPMICGAFKQIIQPSNKLREVDELLVMSLVTLAAFKPEYFRGELMLSAMLSLLRKDALHTVPSLSKGKTNQINCILGVTLLHAAYKNVTRWPIQIMKMYLEDAGLDRQWVDLAECRQFVRTIRYSFRTKASTTNTGTPLLAAHNESSETPEVHKRPPYAGQSPRHVTIQEENERSGKQAGSPHSAPVSVIAFAGPSDEEGIFDSESLPRTDRFEHVEAEVPGLITEVIREAMKRGDGGGKHLVRMLISTAGIPESRLQAMQKIDTWLQNGKTSVLAMNLLATICANCTGMLESDLTVIELFLKVRIKGKTEQYFACVNELLADNNLNNLYTVIRMTLDMEKNDILMNKPGMSWNLQIMAAAFRAKPNESSDMLAAFFVTFIVSTGEDWNRTLKAILHDLSKVYKADVRHEKFVQSFLTARIFTTPAAMTQLRNEDQASRDKKLNSIIDVCLAAQCSLMVTKHKEEVSAGLFENFVAVMARCQVSEIQFLRVFGAPAFSPTPECFKTVLRKIFFLDRPHLFQIMDKWPTETEKMLLFKAAGRILVKDTHLWQLRMQMSGHDINMLIDMVEQLLCRGLSLRTEEYDALQLQDLGTEYIEDLLKLGVFRQPEGATFPPKYRPPALVRRDIYWSCWKLMVLFAAVEPVQYGAFMWERHPTAKALMQMCIINRFTFPPETMIPADKDGKFLVDQEHKMAEDEKKAILEYENRLAGGTAKNLVVPESSAKMHKDFTRFDPNGAFRQPPESFLKMMDGLNKSLELGRIFSGCRQPDFLLEMLRDKGTSASLPWLLEITSSSKSMFEVLPVECVCEMLSNSLLKSSTTSERGEADFQKCRHLASRLSESVSAEGADVNNILKTLNFFGGKLGAETAAEREIARTALEIMFDPSRIESAISSLWGMEKAEVTEGSGFVWPADLPKTKQGLDLEAILASVKPQLTSWMLDPMFATPKKPLTYSEKFHWLLTDIPNRSAHFTAMKDQLCFQLTQALAIECDVHPVAAYFDFLSTYLFSPRCLKPTTSLAYTVVNMLASVMTRRHELRDAVLLGTGMFVSPAEANVIRQKVAGLFETFLHLAVDSVPTDLIDVPYQLSVKQKLLRVECTIGQPSRTACMHLTVAQAYPVLLALMPNSEQELVPALRQFSLNPAVLFGSTEWSTGEVAALVTKSVRQVVLRRATNAGLVAMVVSNLTVDEALQLLCTEHVSTTNLRMLMAVMDVNDPIVLAKLKHMVSSNLMLARTLLEYRLKEGLSLEEPIHRTMKKVLDSVTNIFSLPFTA